jgi:hypothetical protein
MLDDPRRARGTVERILERHGSKRVLADAILGQDQDVLARIGRAELERGLDARAVKRHFPGINPVSAPTLSKAYHVRSGFRWLNRVLPRLRSLDGPQVRDVHQLRRHAGRRRIANRRRDVAF